MNKSFAILLFFAVLFHSGYAQQPTEDYATLKKQVKKNIGKCNSYDPRSPEWEDVNIDSLAERAAGELTRLLKYDESVNLNPDELGLSVDAKTTDETQIRVYSFYYISGGTIGGIFFPVIQWRNKQGKPFAYNLSREWMKSFHNVYLLKKDSASSVYMLLGKGNESSAHWGYYAYVLKFSGDLMFTNYHAFAKQNDLYLTDVEITYDTARKVLHLDGDLDRLQSDLQWQLKDADSNAKSPSDTIANRQYYNLFMAKYDKDPADYPTDNGIDLWFNGNHFVNIGPGKKPDEH
jgi:hypothetical protein